MCSMPRLPLLLGATLVAALTGCATPLPPLPAGPAAPSGFARDASAITTATAAAPAAWWSVFADPVLNGLIERAADANTGVQQAAARLAQARAAATAAGAARAPQLALNAGASRQGGPLVNAAGASGNLFEAGASLAWEVDVAGRLSHAERAATLDVQARQSLLRQARLLMQAEMAQHYFALRAIDQERALRQTDLAALRETLRLVERRRGAGLAPDQEVARARAEVGAAEAETLALQRRREALEHALAFLAGTHAGELRIANNAAPFQLPVVPAGIPAAVLARRPDVAAAERGLQAARARVGAAGNLWAPAFSLTASGGQASIELGDLLKTAARSWTLGALLSLPLFDGGRREARLDAAQADLQLAAVQYREQVLVALREVDDQLSALRWLGEQAGALQSTQDDADRAAALAQSRYERGLTSQLEVLEARAAAQRHRHAALQVHASRQQATVALVRALGGGWGDAPPPVAMRGL